MAEMKEAALVEDAKTAKVPVEVLRAQRDAEERADDLEKQINQLKFQNWQTKIQADAEKLRGEYKMLSKEDMDAATNYILNVARNVDMPLEEAVYAVHGKKIVQALAKSRVQEDLANQSGRKKKTPPSPNNGKAKATATLSPEESYIAKQFGMTGEEYNKFRQ
jgi:phage I-like protein